VITLRVSAYNKILSNIIGFRLDEGVRDVLGVNKTNTSREWEGGGRELFFESTTNYGGGGSAVVADFKRVRKTY